MVSGKPPRHSKSKAEPVTIDLDAKDVTDVSKGSEPTPPDTLAAKAATDKKPGPTTPPSDTQTQAAKPADNKTQTTDQPTAKSENPRPIWDQPVKPPIEPQSNVKKADDGKADAMKPTDAEKLSPTVPPKPATSDSKPDTIVFAAPKSEPPKSEAAKAEPFKAQGSVPPSASKPSTGTHANASTSTGTTNASSKSGTTKAPRNSGFLAAGVAGGLVALLLAGTMQYAGYLPPFSGNNTPSEELTALKSQVSGLQQQLANAPQAGGDTAALDRRLAALEGSASSGGDLSGKVNALESTISALQSERSAQDEKTAELTRRLSDAEAKINEPRDDIEVARAIASAGLKAAIDRGGPFLTELDTLSRVTPDDPAIQALRPFANTGVPSRSELTRDFPDVANAMLDSLKQSDPNQSIVDRLAESAMSLVKVRPVGNVEGEGAEAKIARMEDKLRNGDLKGASLEWDGVPDPAKAVSADYKKSLDARIQVEDLVNGTLNRAITTTGQQG